MSCLTKQDKLKLVQDISKLEKKEVLMEIGKIIVKDDNKITENMYGCILDLDNLKETTLIKLQNYVKFYNEKQIELLQERT
jgi:proline dehydrogenase